MARRLTIVYVLWRGEYDGRRVIGIYSSAALATRDAVNGVGRLRGERTSDYEIEEYTLDESDYRRKPPGGPVMVKP